MGDNRKRATRFRRGLIRLKSGPRRLSFAAVVR